MATIKVYNAHSAPYVLDNNVMLQPDTEGEVDPNNPSIKIALDSGLLVRADSKEAHDKRKQSKAPPADMGKVNPPDTGRGNG